MGWTKTHIGRTTVHITSIPGHDHQQSMLYSDTDTKHQTDAQDLTLTGR